jgi:hypothetical protein
VRDDAAQSRGDESDGPAWAALLAGAIGAFAFAGLTVASEASAAVARALLWYRPAGSLSGVAGGAVLTWAIAWVALHLRWAGRHVKRSRLLLVVVIGLVVAALLGTCPPVYELF